MSDQLVLTAETRERGGKGASRDLRREGRVPAVVYGGKEEPLMIDVGGKQIRTLPKDVAFHPVKDRPIHADFLRIAKGATVQVAVPVSFQNEEASPGLKRGGVLNIVRHELELVCDADKIPDEIAIDVTGFDVGDSIHISNVTLPKGVESAITDRDFTIATIVAPSALKSSDGDTTKDEGEEAAAEGEEEA